MKNGFRQSMAWLHTWTGLTLGWILLAIFMTGTASFFKDEITQWMQPEYQVKIPDQKTSALMALNRMQELAPDAKTWYITLPTPRTPTITAYWQDANGYDNTTINPLTGKEVVARDTRGGEFFYRFHFELFGFPVLVGRIIVGIASMLMFVALISGIITHKKIFVDFFTFRPKKGQRSWLDFHNVSSVMALPFFLMITYTGLAIFFYIYMPWGMKAVYGDESGKFFEEIAHVRPHAEASGVKTQMLPFNLLVDQALTVLPKGERLGTIEVTAPNDQHASLNFALAPSNVLNIRTAGVEISGIDGKLLPDNHNHSAMSVTAGVVYGLHMAHVAQWPLRWLLFLSGMLGCVMIASGMILWTVKRRLQQQKTGQMNVGHYLVERFNIAAIIGLPAAMAGFFLANRVLDAKLEGRADIEIKAFLVVWLFMLIHALCRPWARAWKEQLVIAGLLFLAIPLVNMRLTPEASVLYSLFSQNWVLAGFDMTMLSIGILFLAIWRYLIQNQHVVAAKMKQKIEQRALAKEQAAALKREQ
jgi:uncharacterized iron-regulated membrane protein/low affinity Fe/Cu permease